VKKLATQEKRLVVLFVHGMGRSPILGWPMLFRLRRAGLATETFGYSSALEEFESIADRLRRRIIALSAKGNYVVVGHSLGGVLLRAALSTLPSEVALPSHAFLLGSPLKDLALQHCSTATSYSGSSLAIAGNCSVRLRAWQRLLRFLFPPLE
jgi:Predicted acetyltransferases and hydrolases with the alpha/beta hydrolase fold